MKRLPCLLALILVFSFAPVLFQTPSVQALGDYVVDGDVVYIDDENVRIAIYPHTTSGGWVYLNFTSKRYSGDLDFLFGFNSSLSLPIKTEWYNPYEETKIRSYTIEERYLDYPGMFNYTFGSQDANWFYDGHVYFWVYNETSLTYDSEGYLRYEQANKNTLTLYWTDVYHYDWVKLTRDKLDWKKINRDYKGMDHWFYFSHNVNEDQVYHLRIWFDVLPSLDGSVNKFWFACKRSDQTLQQAISSNQLYYLDPWYDTDWGYRKSHIINASSGTGTNYQVRFVVHYGSGSDSGENVYLNSHSETDFSDVRFVNSTNNGLYDIWNQTYFSSDNATFWVEITENLSDSDVNMSIYYGHSGVSSVSSFTDVFLEGDTFTRANSDTVGTTEILSNTWTEQGAQADFDISSNQLKVTAAAGAIKPCTIPYSRYDLAMDFIINVPTGVSTNWGGAHIRKTNEGDTFSTSGLLIYFRDTGGIEVAGGSPSGDTSGSFTTGQEVLVSIRAYGNDIEVYVDDVKELDFSDSDESGGYVDFADYDLDNVFFDTFRTRKYVDPEPQHHTWYSEESVPVVVEYYYLTVYFDTGLVVTVNSSEVTNASENAYEENATLNVNSDPANTNWEFFGYERQTYNNFTLNNPISIDLIANETVWVYSEIEGEPLLYETVLLFSLLWISLLFFSIFKPNLLLKGGAVIVGFILALDIHSSIATTFGSLLGFAVVCINVGLLVSVLFEK